PGIGFCGQLLPPGRSELIELGAAVVFRISPLGGNQPLRLQAVQRRIQGTLIDLEHVSRHLLDSLRDVPPVSRAGLEGFQHQQVERPLQQVDLLLSHPFSSRQSTREKCTKASCRLSTRRPAVLPRPSNADAPQTALVSYSPVV